MVETLGGWSSEAILNFNKIGQSLGQRTSPTFHAETVKHLFGRLAMALWRGNAPLWLCHSTSLPPFTDGVVYLFVQLFYYCVVIIVLL